MRQVPAAFVAVEWAVEVRPRVSHHLDLADVELRPRGVMLSGVFAAEVVAYHGRGKSSVGDEAVLQRMAHVHELFSDVHDSKPPKPGLSVPRNSMVFDPEAAHVPDAYDPNLDVGFTPRREQDLTAAGLAQAA